MACLEWQCSALAVGTAVRYGKDVDASRCRRFMSILLIILCTGQAVSVYNVSVYKGVCNPGKESAIRNERQVTNWSSSARHFYANCDLLRKKQNRINFACFWPERQEIPGLRPCDECRTAGSYNPLSRPHQGLPGEALRKSQGTVMNAVM
jgi:hypothetical protein